jgi:hypothetical protein
MLCYGAPSTHPPAPWRWGWWLLWYPLSERRRSATLSLVANLMHAVRDSQSCADDCAPLRIFLQAATEGQALAPITPPSKIYNSANYGGS